MRVVSQHRLLPWWLQDAVVPRTLLAWKALLHFLPVLPASLEGRSLAGAPFIPSASWAGALLNLVLQRGR